MQRWRHPGDIREWGDWIVATIETSSGIEGMETACEQLNAATSDMDGFLDLGNGCKSENYKIIFKIDGNVMHERNFFCEATKVARLRPLIAQYVTNVNQKPDTWQDEYHPRGSFAIAELALADVTYVPKFGDIFFNWDMGHETFQRDLIDILFEKYGYTDQTLHLLAARACADGQSINENVWRALYHHGFKEKIDLRRFAEFACCLTVRTELLGWSLEKFVQIYSGRDANLYRHAVQIFTEALRSDQRLIAALEEFQESSYGDFTVHNLIENGNEFWNNRAENWNDGLENASVERTDYTKLVKLPALYD